MMEQKQYNPAIDILRFISILAVVLIHTTTRTLEANHLDITKVPWTLFLNQISRFAVPLFFMISGFVLELNYSANISYFVYLKKRFGRILIPYVFWSFIYYFFVYTKHNINFLTTLGLGSASYQLYFIPSLLVLYIAFPLFHIFYKILTDKWVLLLLGVIQVYILYQDYYIHSLPFFYPVTIAMLNFYIFLLGALASHHQNIILVFIKKWKIMLLAITFLLAGYVFMEGQSGYLKTSNYLKFYSQWRPSVLLYTAVLGSILYYLFNKALPHLNLIKTVARLSFFVFFIHVIVLEFIWYKFGVHFFQADPQIIRQVWFDPIFFLSVAGVSFIIAYVVHKIPYLSKITS